MKVLHVITGLDIGGAEQQLRLMLRHLPVDSEVVTLTAPGAVARGIESDGVPVTHLGMAGNRDLKALPRLVGLIRRGGYDVVHTHLYRACVYGRIAARAAGVRAVVATEHSLGESQIEGRPLTTGTRALYLATERLGSATVAVSDSVARRLAAWGVQPSRIRVVPNGIDRTRFAYDESARRQARARLGLPEDAFVVGGVGRLAPGKCFDRLIRAVASIPDAHLVLVGDGAQRAHLEAVARACGASDRVLLTGPCEDPPAGAGGAGREAVPVSATAEVERDVVPVAATGGAGRDAALASAEPARAARDAVSARAGGPDGRGRDAATAPGGPSGPGRDAATPPGGPVQGDAMAPGRAGGGFVAVRAAGVSAGSGSVVGVSALGGASPSFGPAAGPGDRLGVPRPTEPDGIRPTAAPDGGLPSLPALLSAMDAFVSTSPDEAFGLAIVEALAAGLPVLYVACPAVDDLPPDAAPGARRIGESVPELISALRGIREARLSRLPQPAAAHRYDIAHSARQLMSLYESLPAKRATS